MKAKGCLIALAVMLGLGFVVAALVGPRILQTGEKLYQPIAKIQGAQKDFEAWQEQHPFKEPAEPTLSTETLDRFLSLRKKLAKIDDDNPLPAEGRRRTERPSVDEIQGMLNGVSGNVSGRMNAYREAEMTSDEYRYLDRLIYARWLRPLRAKGQDPASVARAVKEIASAAASEKDPALNQRLRAIAETLKTKRVDVPEGIPPEVHALLFARAAEIDALIDQGNPLSPRRRRNDATQGERN